MFVETTDEQITVLSGIAFLIENLCSDSNIMVLSFWKDISGQKM